MIGSDSADTSNTWGSLLHSYRMYTVVNEEDPDYDYYVVWVQVTGEGTIINPLNLLWTGIKNINDGQIVDWSPAGTIYIDSGEETTVSLGVNVGAASASISQTFNDPSGKIYPNKFTTTQFGIRFKFKGNWHYFKSKSNTTSRLVIIPRLTSFSSFTPYRN